MRNAFANELVTLAKKDPKIVFLTADIGNNLFNEYKSHFPRRFFNCGVAEANMASMAAGLALTGLRPITYTIAPFNVYRCLEQIRIDICYHNLPVTIVGTGAGLSYASLGPTHHSCEDIACLRSFPHLKIVCPGDALELKVLMGKIVEQENPVYFRIGKKNERVVHRELPSLEIGKGHIIEKGTDACLFSTGNTLPLAMDLKRNLALYGIKMQVVSMHTVKPLDNEILREMFSSFKYLFSLEEHSLIGGLGSAICQWMVESQIRKFFTPFGMPDRFYSKSHSQDSLRNEAGLSLPILTRKILEKVLQHANRR